MSELDTQAWMERFEACLSEKGLRRTRPRRIIAEVFLESSGHQNIDELYRAVKERDPKVGYATMYRTLRLLQGCGLASERRFDEGGARFEPAGAGGPLHYHLICTGCGAIEEFEDETIRTAVGAAAERFRMELDSHTLELYGRCEKCRAGSAG